jgi:hypothetical protein
VGASSSGSFSMLSLPPPRASIITSASWITVSVVRPRKSILSIPAFSSDVMSYCVTTTVSSSPAPEPLVVCVHTGT